MPTTQSRHLDNEESMRINGPADVKVTKRSAGSNLGEHDKEGLDNLKQTATSTWETLQTEGGKILDQVQSKGNELLDTVKGQATQLSNKANELKAKGSKMVSDNVQELDSEEQDDEGFTEVHYKKGKKQQMNKAKTQLKEAAGDLNRKLKNSNIPHSMDEVKSKFNKLIDRQSFTLQDALAYLVPLIVLALALTAGISAYRSYSAPAPLPPLNTLDGLQARAGQAYDYMYDKADHLFDYSTERASLLAEQLKDKAGVYSDKAKETLWKSRDAAAEQANLAYREAAKKATEAKKLADERSKEALAELKKYAKDQTKPEGFMDKLSNKLGEMKDTLGRKTGLIGEDARHKAALAAENTRHAAEQAKLNAQNTGIASKLSNAAHDIKESVKAKIHDAL